MMKRRWTDGSNYNEYINAELDGFRAQAWLDLVESHFATGKKLNVLDIGTGPGFFPCILGRAGHTVTGIDMSDGMLSYAHANTERLGIPCTLMKMDAHEIDFPEETFDLIISRNVTWTLERPAEAYAQWKRVLKPGGRLLIYDANWHLQFYDEEIDRQVKANEERYRQRFGHEFKVCRDDRPYYDSLPLSNTVRPDWDMRTLERLGFEEVTARHDVGQSVYTSWELDLYSASPLFEIEAVKPSMPEKKRPIYEYWQDRASTFGFDSQKNEAWARLMREELPGDRPVRVLDVGTGTGAMAIAMARHGYSVTGVDLCPAMIERARENAEREGVDVDFLCTDAGELPFEDASFDVVINRNVLWNIVNPEDVLRQWRNVLAEDGALLYFDSAWYYYLFDEESDRKRERTYQEGTAPRYKDIEDAAYGMTLSDKKRPDWDRENLPKLGFSIRKIEDVSEQVWDSVDCEKYSFAPQFMVVADRTTD